MSAKVKQLIEQITPGNFSHHRGNGDVNGWCERLRRQLLAALEPAPEVEQEVPDGWTMVPIEPTADMLDANSGTSTCHLPTWNRAMWASFLAAAPALSSGASEEWVPDARTVEACAKVAEPAGPRPCDCDRCCCGNIGDAEAVTAWDQQQSNASAIRAMLSEGKKA